MKKATFFLQFLAAFLAAQIVLAVMVYFIPPLRESVITVLRQEAGTWEPAERVVSARVLVRNSPGSGDYIWTNKNVYVYECAANDVQIDIDNAPTWIPRARLAKDVCLENQP